MEMDYLGINYHEWSEYEIRMWQEDVWYITGVNQRNGEQAEFYGSWLVHGSNRMIYKINGRSTCRQAGKHLYKAILVVKQQLYWHAYDIYMAP
jgi:hypothetical protein